MHYGAIRNSRGVAIIPPAGARGAGGGGAHGCVSDLAWALLGPGCCCCCWLLLGYCLEVGEDGEGVGLMV